MAEGQLIWAVAMWCAALWVLTMLLGPGVLLFVDDFKKLKNGR